MRKVLSIVLSLAMVLGTFSFAFAATTPSDVKGTDYEEAVTVLTNLGVITGYEDGNYKPEGIVNRAEATVIVVKALGLEGSVGSQKSSYTDLSGYGWAEGYIAFATQLGIVNGYGDGTFRPGQTVNYNEFATMLVRSLGYTDVSLTGTWPAKYVNQASAVGVMDDVKSGGSAGANRGDVALMANNALTCYIGTVDKDNNWSPTLKNNSSSTNKPSSSKNKDNEEYDTMISRLGGYFYKGVMLDGMDSDINIKPYIGKYVEYYTDEDNGKGNVLAVSKVKSDQLIGKYEEGTLMNQILEAGQTFEGNDDVDYKMGSNVVPDTDRDEWLTGEVTYFRNGESAKEEDIAKTSDEAIRNVITELNVELTGKTVKTLYSVMAWVADSAIQVEEGDLTDITEDQSLLGYDFDTDKNDKIIENSYELVGVNSLDDIKTDNILYVYNAKDDDVIRRVAVGTEVIEGKITKTNDTDEEWTIDGKEYKFADNAPGADSYDDAEAGDTVKAYLDAYGEIYAVDSVSGSAKDYAIVKNIDSGSEQIRLYLADDSSKTYDYDLDNEDIQATSDYWAKGTSRGGLLVGYSLDSDNVVDSIYPNYDNVVGGSGDQDDVDDLDMTKAVKAVSVNQGQDAAADYVRLLSNRVLEYSQSGTTKQITIDSNVVVFSMDSKGDLDISKIEDVDKDEDSMNLNANEYGVQALVRDGDIVALLVDDKYVGGSSEEDIYAVISNAEEAVNDVGDKAQSLEGYANGKTLKGTYTSGKDKVNSSDVTSVQNVYKLKYNDDNVVSKADKFSAKYNSSLVVTGDSVSINSKRYVKVANPSGKEETMALASNGYSYEVTYKNGKDPVAAGATKDADYTGKGTIDEYKNFSGTVQAGYKVWLFDTDEDNSGYEVMIVYKDK